MRAPDADARRSKRDFLPGLEVRLLDHQLVGVSWCAARAPMCTSQSAL
jgi:hypothetical protein